ncbi:acetylxylan esterase [Xylanibacter oryzae]|uniref:acetylxylan esterase n=1 Tax=Xylanibacter oryzae TaxID=185293 RepID=UPI00055F242C|nr:acetylxylan esterase [Xylanibacter oryzae]
MKKILILLVTLMSIQPVSAQIRGYNIRVTVTPDHKDWNYKVGETASFIVNVLKSGTLLDNVKVDYEAGPVMYPNVKKTGVILPDGTMRWSGKMTDAGFYRFKVTAHVAGKDYDGLCTASFSPEKIQPTTECPKDFDEFWNNSLKEARQTSLEPTKELLPERCTKDVNVYQVSFQNIRFGSRTYGILCVPVKPGKYPALLRVPGAGVRPYQGDILTASKGAITLEIGIHGIPVTMTQDYYDKLANGALYCYWDNNMDNRDKAYYKRVFIGAVRAIDYIASMPEWNGMSLGVTGSSQGGMLSLVCAALDKRVTFYGAVHAALCDHTASLKGIACGWPHYFYYDNKGIDQRKIETSRYYDGVNFARRITANGWFSFGYNDEVVPPTSAYGTYNVTGGKKELHIYPETGHYWYQEQWDEWEEWLLNQMGINN